MSTPSSSRLSRRRATGVAALLVVGALFLTACSDDDSSSDATDTTGSGSESTTSTSSSAASSTDYAVFSGQGNNLVAYSPEPPFESQRLFTNATEDPENGRDINAQMCFWDDPDLGRLFIAGEDTNQPDPPAGWGIFRLDGEQVGDFAPTQIGKLTPTYQEGEDPENYGCGMLSGGQLLTTDVGNQAGGDATGQLIVWFPPFDTYDVAYCKVDIAIGTAQSILVDDDDNVYVASSLGRTADVPGGVYRYSGDWPTGPTPDEGCDSTDATDAPLTTGMTKELYIPTSADNGLGFPAGLAWGPDGGMYVSSVFTGVINQYDAEGVYVRTILAPPEGETIGEESFSTGTPLGIGVGPDGTLYYADIGVVVPKNEDGSNGTPGPGANNGNVRRITFDSDGEPQAPETMDEGLGFPDGIGIYIP